MSTTTTTKTPVSFIEFSQIKINMFYDFFEIMTGKEFKYCGDFSSKYSKQINEAKKISTNLVNERYVLVD
jgi:hypothetical protein